MVDDDRRKHARISVCIDVDLTSGHNFYTARTRDISGGGLFIETTAGLAIGTKLTVDLTLLGARTRIDCEVMWVLMGDGDVPVGFGVSFLKLSPSARKRIEEFLLLRSPLSCGEDEDGTTTLSVPPAP